MELFIRLKNGQPFEHPIFGDNFREAFPDVDVNNLPDWAIRFERIAQPVLGVYEKNQQVTYQIIDGVCKDVWTCEQMTDEEKLAKQDNVKAEWAAGANFASWTFNEDTCAFEPPVSYPADDKLYQWDEETTSWVGV